MGSGDGEIITGISDPDTLAADAAEEDYERRFAAYWSGEGRDGDLVDEAFYREGQR